MLISLRQGMIAALAGSVIWAQSAAVFAQATNTAQQEIVKMAVKKMGVGKRVGVELAKGTILHGRITGIGEESFSLRPDHTKADRQIAYDQVTQLKSSSRTLLWAVFGVTIAAVVIIVIALVRTPSVHSPST